MVRERSCKIEGWRGKERRRDGKKVVRGRERKEREKEV